MATYARPAGRAASVVAGTAAAAPAADEHADQHAGADQDHHDDAAQQPEAAEDAEPDAAPCLDEAVRPGRALHESAGKRRSADHGQVPPQTLAHGAMVGRARSSNVDS